jgi:hypothetical protein
MQSTTNVIASLSVVLQILQVMRKMVPLGEETVQSTINVIDDHIVWTQSHLIQVATDATEGVSLLESCQMTTMNTRVEEQGTRFVTTKATTRNIGSAITQMRVKIIRPNQSLMERIRRIWARLRLIMLLMMVTNREISDSGVDQFTTLLSFALLCV